MSMLLVHSKIKPEKTADIEAAVRTMFAAIAAAHPKGIRYTSGRLPDGLTYVASLEIEEGVENPLPSLPAFREFQDNLRSWVAEPPVAEQLTVIGSYSSF